VLVWVVRSRKKRRGKGKSRATAEEEEGGEAAEEKSSRSERRKAQLAQWREKFVQNLESAGLLMEKVCVCVGVRLKGHRLVGESDPLCFVELCPCGLRCSFRRKRPTKRKPSTF